MFLNETNPPLEEALAHYGVLGMRWGRRKGRSESSDYDNFDYHDEERHRRTQRRIAAGALVAAGTVATVVVLHKTGHLKLAADQFKKYTETPPSVPRNKRFANRSFRPDTVGNPLFTIHPKETKDFVDAGFGKSGVFNVTTMARGAKTVKDFDADVWDVPMRALTSGRR